MAMKISPRGVSLISKYHSDMRNAILDISEEAVNSYVHIYKFNQNQYDALVCFTYDRGVRDLKSLLDSGKRTIKQISDRIESYNKDGGVVLIRLQRRRSEEKKLFDEPIKRKRERGGH